MLPIDGSSERPRLPRGVWALGLVSLCMDASSELVHALLPLYVTGVLGASMAALGWLEGVAEATAALLKVFSGAWSDRLGRRKPLVVLGYGLAALTKPLFPLAHSVGLVFLARCLDRVGKGIRGAPRDALLADITPPAQRGAAFGLRQSLDSIGAFVGPLLAVGLMLLFANDVRTVLWFAVIPAALAVLVLVLGVQEPPEVAKADPRAVSLQRWRALPGSYFQVLIIGAVFTLARFSDAFLILRATQCGVPTTLAPLVLVLMSVVYALVSYPAGVWSDGRSPRALLLAGLAVLVAGDLVLAAADGPLLLALGVALWGAHMGLTQGLLSKLVADSAPATLRGTAFGLFNLASGVALLFASVIAGALWEALGAPATFQLGAGFAALAALGIAVLRLR